MADATYVEPIEQETLAAIIRKERPDALLPTLGGQTALNAALGLAKSGVLAECGVELIGARADVIEKAESRELFREAMKGRNLVPFVAAQEPYAWFDNQPQKVSLGADGAYEWRGTGLPLLVYDYGIKWNILRRLCEAGFEPLAVPPNFNAARAKASGAKGVFLSNGPGDPATLTAEIALVRELVGMGNDDGEHQPPMV